MFVAFAEDANVVAAVAADSEPAVGSVIVADAFFDTPLAVVAAVAYAVAAASTAAVAVDSP